MKVDSQVRSQALISNLNEKSLRLSTLILIYIKYSFHILSINKIKLINSKKWKSLKRLILQTLLIKVYFMCCHNTLDLQN